MTRESVCEATAKAMRYGMLALMRPVMTSTDGRCVATTMCTPAARPIWPSLVMAFSTSLGATIMRSASSSMTSRMYGSGRSPSLSLRRLRSRSLAAPAASMRS